MFQYLNPFSYTNPLTYVYGWFGSTETVKNPNESLQQQYEILEKRKDFLEKREKEEAERAKSYLKNGNKQMAQNCLKKKKMLSSELEKIEKQMENLHNMIQQIESGLMDSNVFEMMKEGSLAMNKIHDNQSADDIQNELEKINEIIQDQKERSGIISQTFTQDISEDDLLSELNELEKGTKPNSTPEKVKENVKIVKEENQDNAEEEYKELEKQLLN